ncbi:MAG: PIG-L family deacetylase [Chitinophagaceae bacterium BSSC1]|nr:MAG: PIG-L family deacetylase [Chitinophagaceae bacterium BSSC1]
MRIPQSLFCLLLVGLLLKGSFVNAQVPPTYNSADIYMQLQKLQVLGSVLYVAAHPDDENNGFLPYLAKEKLYRTAYLSLTRGDGGQNLIGSEQGIELGLIRSQELLAARRQDGAEQYFSRAFEFGFSKSAEEALRIWNKEKILADAVWVIRQYQPDVIIARFPGDARAGHGHHAASSIIASEAFIAAADPKRFPEQLKYGVQPWQAKRLLWNTFNFGGANTTSNDQFKLDVGGYNPLLGKSYGEIGGEARSMHKSQGEGRPRRRGPSIEYFTTLGGEAPQTSLMDGVDISWNRIKGGLAIQEKIGKVIANYKFDQPEASVDALVDLYKVIKQLPDKSLWKEKKLAELQELIFTCSGLFFEATTDEEYGVLGQKMNLNVFVNKRKESNVQWDQVWMRTSANESFDSLMAKPLATNQNNSFIKSLIVDPAKKVSQPYWLAKQQEDIGSFSVDDQMLIGQDQSAAAYTAYFSFTINGLKFTAERQVQYKYVDPVRGELYQPFVVITPIIVSLTPDVVLNNIKVGGKQIANPKLQLQYKANFTGKQVPVTIHIKQETDNIFSKDTIMDLEAGAVYTQQIQLEKAFKANKTPLLSAELLLKQNGKTQVYNSYLRAIKYDHIPAIHFFFQNNAHVITDEIKVAGKKIGYVTGAGDKVPDALLQMGYDLQFLHEQDITDEKLKEYDAIVLGIRAHNVFEWLSNKNDIFNRYVEQGGNLIVQYLKSNQIGQKRIKVGPYPFMVNAGSRVTEENAKVNFLLPDHGVLNYPNKITDKDFENWVQERSTYQAEQVDAHFELPIGMNDTGEKPGNGSLAIAKYGKGNFAYVSLVLFRQLPAGIPGAYKLMANLIAMPKNQP